MKEMKGIIAVVTTPFEENGDFNLQGAKDNVDFLIEKGVHGLCILGATGEYQSITTEEHKNFVEEMAKHIDGRVPLAVGTSRERTDDVIDLGKHALENGLDAIMVLPPFYCGPQPNEVVEHYRHINDSVDIPVIVYNNPYSAGIDIELDTVAKLAEMDKMKYIKETSGDIKRTTAIAMDLGDKITPICGWENMCYEAFVMGAKGWICVLANIAPGMCIDIYENIVENKDYEKAYEVYKKALPVLNILEGFPKYVQLVKHILDKQGRVGGHMRRPKMGLTDEEKKAIDDAIDLSVLY